IIMYAGITFLLLSFSPFIMKILGVFLNYIIDFTNIALIYIEHFPYANISNVWFSKTEMILLYGFLFALILDIKARNKRVLASILLLSFTGLNAYYLSRHIQQHKTVFFSLRKNTAVAYIK